MEQLYNILAELEIAYEEIAHEPVYTVEQEQMIKSRISGAGCKNLFLTNQHRTNYLLVILEKSKRADLKQIASIAESLLNGNADLLSSLPRNNSINWKLPLCLICKF